MTGCSGYLGDARSMRPEALRSEPGWVAVHDVPVVRQTGEHDCGAAALAMVLAHYQPDLVAGARLLAEGNQRISAQQIRDRARELGFVAYVVKGEPSDLLFELERGRPVIVGMAKPNIQGLVAHYEVVIGINSSSERVATIDPAEGVRQTSVGGFVTEWQGSGRVLIVIMPVSASAPRSFASHSD